MDSKDKNLDQLINLLIDDEINSTQLRQLAYLLKKDKLKSKLLKSYALRAKLQNDNDFSLNFLEKVNSKLTQNSSNIFNIIAISKYSLIVRDVAIAASVCAVVLLTLQQFNSPTATNNNHIITSFGSPSSVKTVIPIAKTVSHQSTVIKERAETVKADKN